MKEKILISSCLVGNNTKYNGGNNLIDSISLLKDKYDLILICPEVMGGLSIPRPKSEIKGSKVINELGIDVTKEYNLGASLALELAIKHGCKKALLKESSPSCGVNTIYDGTFSKRKIEGLGVTSKLLKENGIEIFSENDIKKLLK